MKKNDKRYSKFIENVCNKDISTVRDHILNLCNVSLSTYYKWQGGTFTPSQDKRVIINGIAFKFNYPIVYAHEKGYKKQSKIYQYGTK